MIITIVMIIMITTRWAARSCSRSRGCPAHEVEGRERKIALQVIDDTDGDDIAGDDDDLSCFVFGEVDDDVFFRYSLGKGDDLYSLKWYKNEEEFYRWDIICNHCELYRLNI